MSLHRAWSWWLSTSYELFCNCNAFKILLNHFKILKKLRKLQRLPTFFPFEPPWGSRRPRCVGRNRPRPWPGRCQTTAPGASEPTIKLGVCADFLCRRDWTKDVCRSMKQHKTFQRCWLRVKIILSFSPTSVWGSCSCMLLRRIPSSIALTLITRTTPTRAAHIHTALTHAPSQRVVVRVGVCLGALGADVWLFSRSWLSMAQRPARTSRHPHLNMCHQCHLYEMFLLSPA